jgi:hypothetical protein
MTPDLPRIIAAAAARIKAAPYGRWLPMYQAEAEVLLHDPATQAYAERELREIWRKMDPKGAVPTQQRERIFANAKEKARANGANGSDTHPLIPPGRQHVLREFDWRAEANGGGEHKQDKPKADEAHTNTAESASTESADSGTATPAMSPHDAEVDAGAKPPRSANPDVARILTAVRDALRTADIDYARLLAIRDGAEALENIGANGITFDRLRDDAVAYGMREADIKDAIDQGIAMVRLTRTFGTPTHGLRKAERTFQSQKFTRRTQNPRPNRSRATQTIFCESTARLRCVTCSTMRS